ncbi:MAG: hypothetical protein Q8L23_01825 [Caulobacter sp.]|nr:hypothetical protein [Caulobacter sp.]
MSDREEIAARNNADWCVAVWRSHGLPVETGPGLVACRRRTPRSYPNVVTVDRNADAAAQADFIAALCAAAPHVDVGVKDSFVRLDLTDQGFELHFDARWVFRAAMPDTADPGPLRWRRVETAADLAAWEAAWSASAPAPCVFRARLLAEPAVAVLAGFDTGDRLRAGGVASRAAGVLGLSNIFGSRRGFLQAAASLWPDLDMVGYETGDDLKAMEYYGFAALGPLRVWTKPTR